ncbi:MAG: biotin--[acetyl-CoA-carboxylase] ligase [Anaerolineales bacterium]|nr:MAG: biotin--[acetyl-CoA-carboxylase] ligase [Anaerolineales bacterium]
MDQIELEQYLHKLPLGAIRYYDRVGSTNDEAARWAAAGGPHLGLVVADEQTAGRGRLNRHWYTPAGLALAFSLILQGRRLSFSQETISQITALGALAVCDALNQDFSTQIPTQIKWPNDVVAGRRKLAGVLAEAHWQGQALQAVILGIGINVAPDSLPAPEELDFPAACLSDLLGQDVDRWKVLCRVLEKLFGWLPRLGEPAFIQAWEQRLAFRGEWVQVSTGLQPPLEGQILGMNPNGSLRLQLPGGEERELLIGDIHLRPVDRL